MSYVQLSSYHLSLIETTGRRIHGARKWRCAGKQHTRSRARWTGVVWTRGCVGLEMFFCFCLHPWRITWNIIMEVWRSFSFLNGWFLGSMLIFQGVAQMLSGSEFLNPSWFMIHQNPIRIPSRFIYTLGFFKRDFCHGFVQWDLSPWKKIPPWRRLFRIFPSSEESQI